MKKIPIWIDTDTGVDDSLALLCACGIEEFDMAGISAVAGNTTIDNAFRNARDVLSLAGREDVKVYKGAEKPLVKPLRTAPHVHGENGLGGAEIPRSKALIETMSAYDALYEKAKELNGELTVCAVGPLTNIAITIAMHPDIVNYIKVLNIMGGAAIGGNITPCAEFNIFVDPHGAENVFKSGIPVNMFGLDVTLKAFLDDEDIKEIISYDNPASRLFEDSNHLLYKAQENKKFKGLCEHDACPVIYTAHPEWFTGQKCGIYVETQGTISQGKTVTDLWTDYKYEDRHCQAFLDVDREKFVTLIKKIYKSY
ncbi:MAG: nucleoside hydrolase [Erysipelotrichaceae bacterium]|nr:nucleoside hydrolase [Erysipelotrichaceae bacterium]